MKGYQSQIPVWNFLCIASGWAAAIALIPEYGLHQRGSLIPAGLVMSCGFLAIPSVLVIRRPDSIFRFEHLLMIGLVYWIVLDAAQGAYHLWGISHRAITITFTAIALFAVSIWVGSYIASYFKTSLQVRNAMQIDKNLLFQLIIICFLCAMARPIISCDLSVVCLIDGLFAPRFQAAWDQANIGNWDTFLVHLQQLGKLVFPLAIALRYTEGRVTWRVVISIIFGLILLLLLIHGGGRRQIGMVLGASVIVWVLLNRPIRWRNLLVIGLISIAVLYLMDIIVTWRNEGIAAIIEEDVAERPFEAKEPLIKVDKNLRLMGYVVDTIPNQYPHTGWQGIYSILAAPIPRSVLPDKPGLHAFPIRMYYPNLPSSPTWSWTCSAACDFYLIGGYMAVLVGGMLFGGFACFANGLLNSPVSVRKALYYGLLAMTLFIALRAVREVVILGIAVFLFYMLLLVREMLISRWRIIVHTGK